MPNGQYGEVTNAELARRMDEIRDAFEGLNTELAQGHQRMRHDIANIQAVHGGLSAKVDNNSERISRVEIAQDKMTWSIIGAYGAILLAIIAAVFAKVI